VRKESFDNHRSYKHNTQEPLNINKPNSAGRKWKISMLGLQII